MRPDMKIEDNLDLTLVMENSDDRDELSFYLQDYGSDDALAFILEDYSTNGSYTYFNPDNANPFVGLTHAPCIAEEMEFKDNGEKVIKGDFWYFERYALECPIETLIEKGRVTFHNINRIPRSQL